MQDESKPSDPAPSAPRLRTGDRLHVTRGDRGELLVVGEIDRATSKILHKALESATAEGTTVIVDLCEVLYVHSAGIAVLYDHATRSSLQLRLRPNSAVARVVRICGLSHVAAIELVPAVAG